jgi:hypothetical protein
MVPATVSTMGKNITVIIRSASSADVKSIQLESQGHLFSVDANITLKLQNIVLKGISANNKALVAVGQGGKLILDSGAKITLNTNTSGHGGGIYVNSGVLDLNDGCEISKNNSSSSHAGGGVFVIGQSIVTIRGGIISENARSGVSIEGSSTVTMTGGIISKNQTSGWGGGVYIHDSSSNFTKRAAQGSSTSGIIYGGTGDNANIAVRGSTLTRNFTSKMHRNTTLGYYDEISTLSDEGWE